MIIYLEWFMPSQFFFYTNAYIFFHRQADQSDQNETWLLH